MHWKEAPFPHSVASRCSLLAWEEVLTKSAVQPGSRSNSQASHSSFCCSVLAFLPKVLQQLPCSTSYSLNLTLSCARKIRWSSEDFAITTPSRRDLRMSRMELFAHLRPAVTSCWKELLQAPSSLRSISAKVDPNWQRQWTSDLDQSLHACQ